MIDAKSWREQPRVLSRHLRRKSTPNLRRRRGIIGLAFTAAACMGEDTLRPVDFTTAGIKQAHAGDRLGPRRDDR